MAGPLIKGALVELMPTFLTPLPNVIVFQFNPETMQHRWTQPEPAWGANPLAVSGLPGESFSFSLAMDANDMIADGNVAAQALAQTTGIYSRLAALEMLLYPTGSADIPELLGSVSASNSIGGSSFSPGSTAPVDRPVPESQVPTVLFVWGLGRILPVRVTGLSITENLYDEFLNPTHADAELTLTVLTLEELTAMTPGPLTELAKVAYLYSQGLRQALALANLTTADPTIRILSSI
jgi:hypothetical protein